MPDGTTFITTCTMMKCRCYLKNLVLKISFAGTHTQNLLKTPGLEKVERHRQGGKLINRQKGARDSKNALKIAEI